MGRGSNKRNVSRPRTRTPARSSRRSNHDSGGFLQQLRAASKSLTDAAKTGRHHPDLESLRSILGDLKPDRRTPDLLSSILQAGDVYQPDEDQEFDVDEFGISVGGDEEDFVYGLLAICERHPFELPAVDSARFDAIDQRGMLLGRVKLKRERKPRRVAVSVDAVQMQLAWWCECESERAARPHYDVCAHVAAFAESVRAEMEVRDSQTRKQVCEFFELQPSQVVEPGDEALGLLDWALEIARSHAEHSDDDAGPDFDLACPTERIAWSIEFRASFYATPIIQKLAKRGGWTKGRQVAPYYLDEHPSLVTPADQKVVDIQNNRRRYESVDELELLRALQQHPHVLLDGDPIELLEQPPQLCIVEKKSNGDSSAAGDPNPKSPAKAASTKTRANNTHANDAHPHKSPADRIYQLKISPSGKKTWTSNGFFTRPQPGQLVYSHTSELTHLFRELERTPTEVPGHRIDELRQRLEPLAHTIDLQLPRSLRPRPQPAQVKHILRLRSFQNGGLRCGLRVQVESDDHPSLLVPGQGRMHRVIKPSDATTATGKASKKKTQRKTKARGKGKNSKQQVQPSQDSSSQSAESAGASGAALLPTVLQRDAQAEVARATHIRERLKFDPRHQLGPWDWYYPDSSETLALLERLGQLGDELELAASWDEESVEPIRIVGSVTPQNLRVSISKQRDWFNLQGSVELGDEQIDLAKLLDVVGTEPAQGFVELQSGSWAKISDRLRRRLTELRDASQRNRSKVQLDLTAIPVIESLRDDQLDIQASKEWEACVDRMQVARDTQYEPPEVLQAELRDYQLDGYRWMRRLAEWGVGGCLADDMGLGKTVQALAVLQARATLGPCLVVAPTSVGFNWQREAERFTPQLNVHLYRETDRESLVESVGPGDLVITSYGLALRDAERLGQVEWGTLVLDEAQAIKNSQSKTSKAIRGLSAQWKLALTGTPMENHLGELWSLFRAVSPGVLGSWQQFRKRFALPIEKSGDAERQQALSQLIRPFVLRRTKDEVLRDLPKRTEINLQVTFSPEERRRYDEMRLAAIGELDDLVGLPDTQDQRFRVLAILTRLRQMACHMGLVDDTWQGDSAKLQLLVEKLLELKSEGHRVLVFSQFAKYLEKIRQAFTENEISFEYLDGQTPAKMRQKRVDQFQAGETDAFLISVKAGGTGLNLTAADYVIHTDPWWNPAVEDQATDRAHRIGQTKPVIVYRLITADTVEEKILALHAEKRDLVASIMDGTQAAGAVSTDELIAMIRGEA